MTELLRNCGRRIAYAYSGALLLPVVFLPLAYVFSMGGHSLMLLGILGSPAGVVLALALADRRRQVAGTAILLRSVIAVGALLGCLAVLGSLRSTPFLVSHGWIFILPAGPLAAAVASGLLPVGKAKRETVSARSQDRRTRG